MHENDPKVHLTRSGEPYKLGRDLEPGEQVFIEEWVPGSAHDFTTTCTVVEVTDARVVLETASRKRQTYDAEMGFLLKARG